MSAQLKRLTLHQQGLASKRKFGSKLQGTLNAIEHLGYVQIDTISVIERAHHHVLWNRVPGYELNHLNELVAKQHIFEYWAHAASYLPMRDYRFALPQMAAVKNAEYKHLNNADPHLMNEILARVHAEGPLRARHFDSTNKAKGGWWNWGPAKRAIERLFMQGDLMVSERAGMEKIYDIAERCIPKSTDTRMPSLREYAAYLFDTTLRAHGVFTWKQLIHLKTGKALREAMRLHVEERLDAGEIIALDALCKPMRNISFPLKLSGAPNTATPKYYADAKTWENSRSLSKHIKILSPFDNLLIHRERLSALFDFDYTIECYVPAAKRQYGYFSLPILYGHQFIARIDCKAHRAEKRFEVISLHLEKQADISGNLLESIRPSLQQEIQRFADFNQCPSVDDNNLLSRW